MKISERQDPLEHVAVALDTSDRETFGRWCRDFGPRVGVLKVGLEAFSRWGIGAVEEARRHAKRLFLDLKLHDIPNTVRGAVVACREAGVDLLTVHAAGGTAMLVSACEAAEADVRILAVTLLTHLDQSALEELDLPGEGAQRARRWARLASRSGCAGAICSPLEVALLRQEVPRAFLLVTPGIRSAGSREDDQKRVATAAQALRDGANLLVVGRPLTRAADPEAALSALAAELEAVT
jgi:orotidine-5'-phosphate decarboxylase